MERIFGIYLYTCGIIISICIITGLMAIMLNFICYFYQTVVGFDIFKKFLKKYNKEMQKAKKRKCNKCVNFKTEKCPNSFECYATINKPYFTEK